MGDGTSFLGGPLRVDMGSTASIQGGRVMCCATG